MSFFIAPVSTRTLVLAMGLVAGIVIAACGGDGPAPTPVDPTPVAVLEPTATSAPPPRARDADAVRLAELAQAAVVRAREVVSDAVLPQIYIDPNGGRHVFYFTDAASTRSFEIVARDTAAPPGEWEVILTGLSPLLGHPRAGIDADALAIGPETAIRVSAQPWPGCETTTLTLGGQGDHLTWTVFCNTATGGLVLGFVDGGTGEFIPSTAPPALTPPTAELVSEIGTQVGAIAPDFTLEQARGGELSLASYRGESNVVLIFYRGAW